MATIGAWQEGYYECEVLRDDCRFYDAIRHFNANQGDIIYLPHYTATLEEQSGFVSIVVEKAEVEVDVVTHGNLDKQVVYDEVVHEMTQLNLLELKKITRHLQSMTDEIITDEDVI